MQEENQNNEEIRLSDIFHSLGEHIIILLIVVLAAISVGSGFAFFKYRNVHYYGAKTTYYITSSGKTSSGSEENNVLIYNTYKEEILKQIKMLLSSELYSKEVIAKLPEGKDLAEGTPEYESLLKAISHCVSYNYEVGTNIITIKVRVLNNPEFAEHLLKVLRDTTPDFIKTILGSSDFGHTICKQLDFRPSALLNPNEMLQKIFVFGVIFGLIAFIITSVIVVMYDRTNSKIHDINNTMQKFGAPVLGIIPEIKNIKSYNETRLNEVKRNE